MIGQETYDEWTTRSELAERLLDEFNGRNVCTGLFVEVVRSESHDNAYVCIADGQDQWVALLSHYETAVGWVIDELFEKSKSAHWALHESYSQLCQDCPAIYSRVDTSKHADAEWDDMPADCRYHILEWLGHPEELKQFEVDA